MQPRQARRGTAAVASSTLLLGVVLTILAVVLSSCSGSDNPQASAASAATTTNTSSTAAGAPGTPSSDSTPATSGAASTPATDASTSGGAGTTRPPVEIDQTATFTAGLTSTVVSIEPVTATAALPGEIAGPAVRLTLVVQNGSPAAVDLGNVTVDLQDAAAASATSLTGNGAAPFTGALAPGSSATGVYVFALDPADRDGVTLYVTASASLPVVVFAGNVN